MKERTYLSFKSALMPSGWQRNVRLGIEAGTIVSIDSEAEPSGYGVALPGLPNLHSHAFQRALTGLTERRGPQSDSFWSWREQMYRFLDRMDPDDMRAVASLAYVEMLESGITRVGEFHYLHHDERGVAYDDPAEMAASVVAAAAQTGIGLTLLPVFYAHSNFGGEIHQAGQRRFITDLGSFETLWTQSEKHLAKLPDGRLGLAPHSLRAVTPAELNELLKLAKDGPIHIHAAEQVREVEDSRQSLGKTPVEWLLDHADIDHRWCLIHATHMTPSETERLARSGATAGLCPITEANLGDGIFPAQAFVRHGGRYGIGTDSNVWIDALAELRQLEYGQRLSLRARNVLATVEGASTGGTLYRQALEGGSRALGVAGGIALGNRADLVSLQLDHPTLWGKSEDTLLDALVFGGSRAIEHVWRAGVQVVRDGRHRDRDTIEAAYRAAMTRLTRDL